MKSNKIVFSVFILFSIFFSSCSSKKSAAFANAADLYLTQNRFHGSVIVAKKGKVIYSGGFGYDDPKAKNAAKITVDTSFEIGSLTKQMTAAAIMQLVEKHKLKLTDNISLYFPEYEHGDKITIEMLLNMRSGLTDHINATEEFFPKNICKLIEKNQLENKALPENLVLDYFYQAPLIAEPDSTYFYCNTNYYLLAKIIEQISGLSYEEYLKQNIFEKCKMTNANCSFQATDTKGYSKRGRYYSIPEEMSLGCGNVNASAADLLKWHNGFFTGKVVSRKSVKKMTKEKAYGYGMYRGKNELFHGGVTNVFNSYLSYNKKTKTTIIVLCNEGINKCNASFFGREIYNIYKAECN